MDQTTEEEEPRITFRVENDEANRPAVDQVGRRNLHKIGLATWFQSGFMRLGIPFSKIPGNYWVQDADGEGFTVAKIACPCGETPTIYAGTWDTCVCERAYAFTGDEVFVINSQKAQDVPEADAPQ